MVADQRRKRINSANGVGSSMCDHYKSKKKKLELSKGQKSKLRISLEWDGIQSKVIARRDQVSLSKRDLRSFVNSFPQSCNHSADVISVPLEVFGLKNLKEVLSYEAWQNCLSESEKKSLLQFLPGGPNQEKVVEELLSGVNFNFGNPFIEWGAKLCSGNLHPDAVSLQDKCLIGGKRAYYTDIQKYHNDMIRYLQKLKEICESSKKPETEVLESKWRSTRGPTEKKSRMENGSRFHCRKDVLATSSDSLSLIADDIACSGGAQISPLVKERAPNKRIHHNGSTEKIKKQLLTSDDGKKGEVVYNRNLYQSDGAKYMSILKISKKQHDLVKSMMESGKSIKSKLLNRLLGTIHTSRVKPYEEFEKEEKKKLHEHWLQLVNMELPVAYAKWRKGQLERGKMLVSLCQEVDDKLNPSLKDKEKVNLEMVFEDQNDGEVNLEANEEDEENLMQEVQDDGEVSNREAQLMIVEDAGSSFLYERNDQDTRNQKTSIETCEDIGSGLLHGMSPGHDSSQSGGHDRNKVYISPGLLHGMSLNHASSLSGGHDPSENYVEFEGSLESKSNNAPLPTSEFSMKGNTAVASFESLTPFSSGGNFYLGNTSSGDTSMSECPSSSGGIGYVGGAYNPDPSIYQGFAFSSSRDIISVDINDADASIGQGLPVSSRGGVYAVDVDNINPSFMRGLPVCLGGDVYSVDGDDADTSISRGVPISSRADVCLGRSNKANSSIGQGPISCGRDDWSVANMGLSYYNLTVKEEYSSHRDGPPCHQVNGAQHTTLINLEGETRKNVLSRHCDGSSFSSYPNPDRSGLLQSLFKGHEVAYQQEFKNTGLYFRSANNVLLQDGVFVERMQGQLQSLIPTVYAKKSTGGNNISQNVTNEMCPTGGGYLIPRLGHMPQVNLPEWASNQVSMQPRIQPRLPNDEIPSQNWFPGQYQVRGVWSDSNGTSFPNQSIGNYAEQGLYSGLSQCNQLRSDRHFNSIGHTEQFMLPKNYAMVSAASPRINNALPQAPNPLGFLRGHGTGISLAPVDMSWMNISQSSTPQDPLRKPFLRSGNQ